MFPGKGSKRARGAGWGDGLRSLYATAHHPCGRVFASSLSHRSCLGPYGRCHGTSRVCRGQLALPLLHKARSGDTPTLRPSEQWVQERRGEIYPLVRRLRALGPVRLRGKGTPEQHLRLVALSRSASAAWRRLTRVLGASHSWLPPPPLYPAVGSFLVPIHCRNCPRSRTGRRGLGVGAAGPAHSHESAGCNANVRLAGLERGSVRSYRRRCQRRLMYRRHVGVVGYLYSALRSTLSVNGFPHQYGSPEDLMEGCSR